MSGFIVMMDEAEEFTDVVVIKVVVNFVFSIVLIYVLVVALVDEVV